MLGGLAVLMLAFPTATHSQAPLSMTPRPQRLACCEPPQATSRPATPPPMRAQADPPSYDEQIGMTFTQSFTSLAYNVTAIEQSELASGYGPGYLLNGLSNRGYWYQAGLSYNWDGTGTYSNYSPGFNFNYEVFDTTGNSIYPTNGEGGIERFTGPVRAGDTVLLNLYFSGTYGVVMLAKDYDTGATASRTFSAEGASEFVGSPNSASNSNGFFTGLMTEWYHSSAFYGNISPVIYSNPYFPLTSAWMWIDEFKCPDTSCNSPTVIFTDSTSGPVQYSGSDSLHEFSSNGATEYSSAYRLITGPAYWEMTVSYSVTGGGTGYGQPIFHYSYKGAAQTATLSQLPATYTVDAGSAWSVSSDLPGSTSSERWGIVGSPTSGTPTSSQTIIFEYTHQYLLTVTGGSGGSDGSGWYASSTTAVASSSGVFARSSGVGKRITSYSLDGQTHSISPTEGTVSVTTRMDSPQQIAFGSVSQFQVALDTTAVAAVNSITPPTINGDRYWYDEGTSVTVVLNGVWGRQSGTGSRLASYTVTGGSTLETTGLGSNTVLSLSSISSPQTIDATAVKQYALSTPNGVVVSMTPPSIQGDASWYDSGSNVTVEYAHAWNVTSGESRVVATGYKLGGGGTVAVPVSGNGTFSVSFIVNSPQTVDVTFATQYFTRFVVTNAAGSKTITPSDLMILADNQTQEVQGLATWLDSGSTFSVSNVTFGGVDVVSPAQTQYSVDGPATVTVKALVYDAAVKVTDPLGLPVAGAQVKMTLVNGTTLSGQTGANGVFVARSIPLGNYTARISSLGLTAQASGDASAVANASVEVLLSAVVVALFVLLITSIAGSAFLLRRRSRKLQQRTPGPPGKGMGIPCNPVTARSGPLS